MTNIKKKNLFKSNCALLQCTAGMYNMEPASHRQFVLLQSLQQGPAPSVEMHSNNYVMSHMFYLPGEQPSWEHQAQQPLQLNRP